MDRRGRSSVEGSRRSLLLEIFQNLGPWKLNFQHSEAIKCHNISKNRTGMLA